MTLRNAYNDFRLPAEWEEQSCIQLTWPHANTDWKPYLPEITETFMLLTREIASRQKLLIVTPDEESTRAAIEERWGGEVIKNVVFFACDTNDTWARDHAPLTLVSTVDTKEAARKNQLLDFKFNGWGEKFEWQKDNAINIQLHRAGCLAGALENHTDFVLEGGAIESDGQGTIMTTASCLLAPHRNEPLSREQIEERLLNYLNAKRIVWIEHGELIGDDTDGHIDTIVRMAPADTLVYVGCEDERDEHYADFAALEEQLKTLTTIEGLPYRLLKLPMPHAMYDHGDRLPATYANFVILNDAVIVPTYNQPDNDRAAMDVVAKAFPDREIVGIDASTVVRQHGSLHCLTMQYPCGVVEHNGGKQAQQ